MQISSIWQKLHAPLRRDNLRYLSYYFGIITLVLSVMVYVFTQIWGFALPLRVLWLTLPMHILLTGFTFVIAARKHAIYETFYLLLLLLSVAILGLYLYDSGGHTNPLISLLLLPLAISAALLSWTSTLILAVTASGLYTTLTRFYIALAASNGQEHHVMHIHLLGMWLTFGLSASIVVGLITPMAASMRRQREYIAQQREKMLRDERLVAMATFAASAAHQLGTPLATLAVVTEDLSEALADRPDLQEDFDLMRGQIKVCKNTLHSLMRRSESIKHGITEPILVDEWIQRLRQQFNLLHPSRSLLLLSNTLPQVKITCDETLDQALMNLLDNAARVSKLDPTLEVTLDHNTIVIEIKDSGPGVPSIIKEQLGEPFVTSRTDGSGMGLGLFLSNAAINRLGGSLRLLSSTTGTLTEVILPVTQALTTGKNNA